MLWKWVNPLFRLGHFQLPISVTSPRAWLPEANNSWQLESWVATRHKVFYMFYVFSWVEQRFYIGFHHFLGGNTQVLRIFWGWTWVLHDFFGWSSCTKKPWVFMKLSRIVQTKCHWVATSGWFQQIPKVLTTTWFQTPRHVHVYMYMKGFDTYVHTNTYIHIIYIYIYVRYAF